ncbi:MAG: PQQ-dependent sugar dehydrogenase [Acidimicrobiales bacterium]
MDARTVARRVATLAAGGLALVDCGPRAPAGLDQPFVARPSHHFDLERVAGGLNRPTYVGAAPGDPDGLWVLEQPGRVLRVVGGQPAVALDISDSVRSGVETGLLGIAFHPRFAINRRLFLHWSDTGGDTAVAEFVAAPDGRTIGPDPVRRLLSVDQPEENHNGGQLAFGPDGRLYLGLGDGGGAFDPLQAAQDPDQQLGKILATGVDQGPPRWESVVIGVRNPWRFSFDFALGDLWVADVGQDRVEEVNRVRLEPDQPPKNLGWSAYEGRNRIEDHRLNRRGALVHPVATYAHDQGCSIIGGSVYGGARLTGMVRRYVFGDFCAGTLWSLAGTPGGGATDVQEEMAKVPQLTHIGTDADGELVFASGAGSIFRAVPVPAP